MPKIKYFTSVRKELLNKAVEEYLANHPEEIRNLHEKDTVVGIGVKEKPATPGNVTVHATTGVFFRGAEYPGPEWPGWREIPIGEHKPGYWVVGTKCSWRGTKTGDEDSVPPCTKEIPPYVYKGGKYEQYCCNLHAIYTQAAYTIEQIKNRIRVTSGKSDWKSPLDVNLLSIMIEMLEQGSTLADISKEIVEYRVTNSLVLFNHPIMQAKYPKAYTQELIERIKAYRKIDNRIAKMIRADMIHRGIDEQKAAFIYGVSVPEIREAMESLSKDNGVKDGNEKNKN